MDDIVLAGNNKEIMNVKEHIKTFFHIKDIGNIDFVIGIKFEKCVDGYIMHQRQYIKDLINRFKLAESSPVKILKPVENIKLRRKLCDETLYGSAVGNILY